MLDKDPDWLLAQLWRVERGEEHFLYRAGNLKGLGAPIAYADLLSCKLLSTLGAGLKQFPFTCCEEN
jgi:hypothetical protein